MAWVKLDDGFTEHPKVQEVGGDAAWLHVCALSYCNRNLTDGFIASGVVHRLSDRRNPRKLAERLTAAGLWDVTPGGWTIHDYLEFQPSKAKVDAERVAARERMAALRAAKEAAESSGEQSPNFAGSSASPTRPDVPSAQVPLPPQSLDSAEGGMGEPSSRLSAIADAYASLAYRLAVNAGRKITYEHKWKAKARTTALGLEDTARLAAMFPTAPADAVAAWLHGDKGSMQYYPRRDELATVTELRPA